MRNPYSESSGHPENLTLKGEEELCELQCDHTLKIIFTDLSLDKFWISVKEEFPTIHMKEIDVLLLFLTSCTCELLFSYLTSVKCKDKIVSFLLRMKSVCVCLMLPLELSICIAKDRHRFHIREACFTLSNDSARNIFLVHLLISRTFCLDQPYFF